MKAGDLVTGWHYALPEISAVPSPLASDAWLAWNESKWGVRARRVLYQEGGPSGSRLEGVTYHDARGRIVMPPLNAYLPFRFTHTQTSRMSSIASQWATLAEGLVEDLRSFGMRGTIVLPPGLVDARPFQWSGFSVLLRYTYIGSLPIDESRVESSVRKRIRKAVRLGYTASPSEDWDAILGCLEATETSQGFAHHLTRRDLAHAADALKTSLLGHVVRSPDGDIASGGIRLCEPGGMVLDWVQGAIRSHLPNGVNQLIYRTVLQDATEAGGVLFDNAGANIKAVAQAKMAWNFPLVPALALRQPGLRFVAESLISTAAWSRRRLLDKRVSRTDWSDVTSEDAR